MHPRLRTFTLASILIFQCDLSLELKRAEVTEKDTAVVAEEGVENSPENKKIEPLEAPVAFSEEVIAAEERIAWDRVLMALQYLYTQFTLPKICNQ